jgi:hypothetical protein
MEGSQMQCCFERLLLAAMPPRELSQSLSSLRPVSTTTPNVKVAHHLSCARQHTGKTSAGCGSSARAVQFRKWRSKYPRKRVSLSSFDDDILRLTLFSSSRQTDDDGRCLSLLSPSAKLSSGIYRIKFETGPYFEKGKRPTFYPQVEVSFLKAQ